MRRSWRASLRWRFIAAISVVLLVAVGVSFAIIYHETSRRLQNQVAQDVEGDSNSLAGSLRLIAHPTPARVRAGASRYVSGQPFSSSATLLFVLVPGAAPVSNYPELFNIESKPDDDESAAEQRAENRLAAALLAPHPGTFTRSVADVGSVRLREQAIRLGGQLFYVGAGEPLISVIRAQRGVVHSFLVAGVFIAAAVLLGAFLVGSRVTAPLSRMAAVAARVDAGDLRPRMETGRADEIGVLAGAFNHMLGRLDDAFAAQRAFVADASHELRTPLTVIQGQLEVLARKRDPAPAEIARVQKLVEGEIQRMRRLVDDLLLLAQSERPDFLREEPVNLSRFLEQLLDDATLIADRHFDFGPVPGGRLHADPDRLAQAVRNLLTNAIDHTAPGAGRVRLEAVDTGSGSIAISVLDDGAGIPDAELERVFERFHRAGADRAAEFGGAGLGLAIVRAIAEAHGGSIAATNDGIDGGARFTLTFPRFDPAARPPLPVQS